MKIYGFAGLFFIIALVMQVLDAGGQNRYLVLINIDSIKQVILNSGEFNRGSDDVDVLQTTFKKYYNHDSTEIYVINTNLRGEIIDDDLGLSIIYFQYDSLKREIKRMGLNAKGEYSFHDFPPLTVKTYKKDSIITDIYHYDNRLERLIEIRNTRNKIIREEYYDNYPQLFKVVCYRYSKNFSVVRIKNYDASGREIADGNGMVVHYKKYDVDDSSFVVEERFYNKKRRLADAKYYLYKSNGCYCMPNVEFSIIKRHKIQGIVFVDLYNSKGILVYSDKE